MVEILSEHWGLLLAVWLLLGLPLGPGAGLYLSS